MNSDPNPQSEPDAPSDSSAPQPGSSPAPKRKRSAWRTIKWTVLVIVLVIIAVLVGIYLNLNSIVRTAVQKQSQAQLNVPTSLQSASLSLFGGSVGLKGFDVGSPPGFNAPHMLSLGGVHVGVKLSELRQEPLHVSQITITDPKLVLEMQGMKFNVKQFMQNLPAGEPQKSADQSQPMKLIINDLKVNGAQVIFKPDLKALSSLPGIGKNLSGLKQEYTLNIPALDMQNVGSGEGNQNGAAIKDIVSLLVTQLAERATQSNDLPPELRNVLNLNVSDLADMAKARLGQAAQQQLGKISQDLSKNLPPDAANALKQGLGGMLNQNTGTTQPATTNPTNALEQGLGNLLGGKKKK